jgi:pyruvate formate lyase activating enzyme
MNRIGVTNGAPRWPNAESQGRLSGMIYDIMRYSTRDGPGIRTTVFLKGCPLRCAWCHNPESQALAPEPLLRPDRCIACGACVSRCAQGAISWVDGAVLTNVALCVRCGACATACYADAREMVGRTMTVTQVMSEISRDTPFFDESGGGVTFSGGEPLAQPEFLAALLTACRALELQTAVDTSGYAAWSVLARLRADVDLFLYDLKLIDDTLHRRFTGVSNVPILRNLESLLQSGSTVVVRMPVIPGINDDEQALRALGTYATSLPRLAGLAILPYHRAGLEKYRRLGRQYDLANTEPPSQERMEQIAATLAAYGLPVRIGD